MHIERGLYESLEVARAMVRERGREDFSICLGGNFPPGTLERCKAFVAEHRLEENVRLVESFLPQDEVIEYYRAAQIGYCPYLNVEKAKITLQNKLLEFMGARLPVITSPSSRNGEIVSRSGCGALFWADQIGEICDQLESWMDRPEERKRLGQLGWEYVHQNLVWEGELEAADRWLRSLL